MLVQLSCQLFQDFSVSELDVYICTCHFTITSNGQIVLICQYHSDPLEMKFTAGLQWFISTSHLISGVNDVAQGTFSNIKFGLLGIFDPF